MSPFVSKLLAVSLLIGGVALLVLGLALPVADRLQQREAEIADLEAQRARFAAAAPAHVEARVEILDTVLLPGGSNVVAMADMQEEVEAAIEDAGGIVQSVQTEETRPFETGQLIPLTVDLTVDAEGLTRALHRIETHQPYLIIRDMEARRTIRRRESESREISVRLRLFGVADVAPAPE